MSFNTHVALGSTGLTVGRLGIASSYRAPSQAYEEAFERGCNYWTWGTFIRGRSRAMKGAIKNVVLRGDRDKLVLSMLTYAHNALLTRIFLERGLRELGTDYTDLLLLGYYSGPIPQAVLQGALELKDRGLVRFLGVTTHNRSMIPAFARDRNLDVFHVRYNAVHRGAEFDVFDDLPAARPPGVVAFTATSWGQLMDRQRLPRDVSAASPTDCYRFVLSNPNVHVCMTGPRTKEQMQENLRVLDMNPMTDEELTRMRGLGDLLHRKRRAVQD